MSRGVKKDGENKPVKLKNKTFEDYLNTNFEDDGTGPGEAYLDPGHALELLPCGKCGRQFKADRLTTHENICKNVKGYGDSKPISRAGRQRSGGSTVSSSSEQPVSRSPTGMAIQGKGSPFPARSISRHNSDTRENSSAGNGSSNAPSQSSGGTSAIPPSTAAPASARGGGAVEEEEGSRSQSAFASRGRQNSREVDIAAKEREREREKERNMTKQRVRDPRGVLADNGNGTPSAKRPPVPVTLSRENSDSRSPSPSGGSYSNFNGTTSGGGLPNFSNPLSPAVGPRGGSGGGPGLTQRMFDLSKLVERLQSESMTMRRQFTNEITDLKDLVRDQGYEIQRLRADAKPRTKELQRGTSRGSNASNSAHGDRDDARGRTQRPEIASAGPGYARARERDQPKGGSELRRQGSAGGGGGARDGEGIRGEGIRRQGSGGGTRGGDARAGGGQSARAGADRGRPDSSKYGNRHSSSGDDSYDSNDYGFS
jgi:hypothetical protein